MILALTTLMVKAQYRHRPCDRDIGKSSTRMETKTRNAISGEFHYPVVLAAFPDRKFNASDAETIAWWNAILNEEGFSEQGAKGCVTDYFKHQSGGQFIPVFDILGVVEVSQPMAYYGGNKVDSSGNESPGEDKNPRVLVREACLATGVDFAPYDHDGDNYVDIAVVICAGAGEHKGGGSDAIWPHKWTTSGKVGSVSLDDYICLTEMSYKKRDGHGTFIHEFSHFLGLPDLYPISGNAYSIFDEWDLMDGGNYSNNGFSPPNYSAFERSLCGWVTLKELTDATTITDMPVWDNTSVAYKITNSADSRDYYILENRHQVGWDSFVPGNGLLVTHVNNYNGTLSPNTSSRTQVDLVPADNRSYQESKLHFATKMFDDYGRNRYLSLAAYPYISDEVVNNSLTDVSSPAMSFSEKPVTNIQMDANGLISFDFMKESTAVAGVQTKEKVVVACYDLHGNLLPAIPQKGGVFMIRYADGTTRKVIR